MKRRQFLGFCSVFPIIGLWSTKAKAGQNGIFYATKKLTIWPKMKGRRDLQIELYENECKKLIDKLSKYPKSTLTIIQENVISIDQKICMDGCTYHPKISNGLVLTKQELSALTQSLHEYTIGKFAVVYSYQTDMTEPQLCSLASFF